MKGLVSGNLTLHHSSDPQFYEVCFQQGTKTSDGIPEKVYQA
jgi:hypothetical protein